MRPNQHGFKMPAEWHHHTRCWMAWPCHLQTWAAIGLESARKAYANVASAIAQYEPVWMIVNPEDLENAKKYCKNTVQYFPLPINDSWMRDAGPTFLIDEKNKLAGVDWIYNAWGENYSDYHLDQQIARAVIKESQADYFRAPLVMEGGSFHVDGEGTLLTTRECLLNKNRNSQLSQTEIEQYLSDYLSVSKIIWLNKGLIGDDTNGHVDEIACFLAPGKVLCLITEDKTDPNYEILQENLNILKSARDANDRSLEVYTIQQPPATYLKGERLTLSYINFYHANKGLVIPEFGYKDFDQAALEFFSAFYPEYKITQINALDIFAGGGGIHCITQQQPAVKIS
ncbi:agmatine deiminase family protein [Legionella israelensis]|uniref:Putative agmatine deiminase n=1 Tax=Legionella israelensis TaxID=454 RepID=A0A0W0VUL9_9GAMM|nr:agmatine deiminase family protein [Legionella israelensis]KTD23710.1 peptidylarginine deiminase [Legionella israelensis]QBS10910.1 agmatine deiminase family protein [Legionella israelensis]SCX80067.1 agmatine deiminase [Legionella israelensis DSM 19235]STX57898.1 peptidylarginine deiminase [Legionella israelensis]